MGIMSRKFTLVFIPLVPLLWTLYNRAQGLNSIPRFSCDL